jgi:hypothetical protein
MQDFANYREHTASEASIGYSASWSPDIPSLFIGILLGVAACLAGLKVAQTKADQAVFIEAPIILEEVAEKPFVFEFYDILKNR